MFIQEIKKINWHAKTGYKKVTFQLSLKNLQCLLSKEMEAKQIFQRRIDKKYNFFRFDM